MHRSAADPLEGMEQGTADKTFSLERDHHVRKARGLVGCTVFSNLSVTISKLSISSYLWGPQQYCCKGHCVYAITGVWQLDIPFLC